VQRVRAFVAASGLYAYKRWYGSRAVRSRSGNELRPIGYVRMHIEIRTKKTAGLVAVVSMICSLKSLSLGGSGALTGGRCVLERDLKAGPCEEPDE
jgi:hypothetical protein